MGKGPVIRYSKAPRRSFKKNRPLAKKGLLESQVEHFREVEKGLPEEHRSKMPPHEIDTEDKAAKFIRHVTLKLHELKGKA